MQDARPGRGRRLLTNLALAAGAVAVTLTVLEMGLRIAGFGAIYDVYSKPSVLWRHDPRLGWSHEPGSETTYVGPRPFPVEWRTPVRINSVGLRGPELAPLPPGGVRVLALGDSLVAGFEVRFEETFTAQLEKRLARRFEPPVQVVNAGVRGYGTDQAYLYYTERGRALEPHVVIYFQSLNDAENNVTLHRMRRPFGKAAFGIDADGGLSPRGMPIPRYPLCSAWVLDADYQPVRADTARARGLCAVQTRLSDHSALFSWITLRLTRAPGLVRFLYGLGAGEEQTARAPAAHPVARLAALLPFVAAPAHASEGEVAPPFALTTTLVTALGREVTADGGEFVYVAHRGSVAQMDRDALDGAGVEPRYVELNAPPDVAARLRFRNDAHLTAAGHYLMARLLEPHVEPAVERAFARVSPGS